MGTSVKGQHTAIKEVLSAIIVHYSIEIHSASVIRHIELVSVNHRIKLVEQKLPQRCEFHRTFSDPSAAVRIIKPARGRSLLEHSHRRERLPEFPRSRIGGFERHKLVFPLNRQPTYAMANFHPTRRSSRRSASDRRAARDSVKRDAALYLRFVAAFLGGRGSGRANVHELVQRVEPKWRSQGSSDRA